MADSVVTVNVLEVDATRRNIIRTVQLKFSAGDYATGGQPIDLTGAVNVNNKPYAKFTRTPDFGEVMNQPVGYHLKLLPGSGATPLTNWLAQLFVTGAGNDAIFHEVTDEDALDATLVADTNIIVRFLTQKGH